MPYVEQKYRNVLDPYIEAAFKAAGAEGLDHTTRAGLLAYIGIRFAQWLFPVRRFWTSALVIGTFVCMALEWYRRVTAPYENDQRNINGEVF